MCGCAAVVASSGNEITNALYTSGVWIFQDSPLGTHWPYVVITLLAGKDYSHWVVRCKAVAIGRNLLADVSSMHVYAINWFRLQCCIVVLHASSCFLHTNQQCSMETSCSCIELCCSCLSNKLQFVWLQKTTAAQWIAVTSGYLCTKPKVVQALSLLWHYAEVFNVVIQYVFCGVQPHSENVHHAPHRLNSYNNWSKLHTRSTYVLRVFCVRPIDAASGTICCYFDFHHASLGLLTNIIWYLTPCMAVG